MLGFCWKKIVILPHQLFSKVDMGKGFDVMQCSNSHAHPTTRFGKEVCLVVPNIDTTTNGHSLVVWWPL
jgi:hypothetical protein